MSNYEIESSVFIRYFDEIIEVSNSQGWIFIITENGKRKAALLPYKKYWNTIDDGK